MLQLHLVHDDFFRCVRTQAQHKNVLKCKTCWNSEICGFLLMEAMDSVLRSFKGEEGGSSLQTLKFVHWLSTASLSLVSTL